ncbi:MAG: small-conductance mechanosensitive channel [Sulfurimonas sp.]|jgi:small-conductance mechanosensitive channel
MNKVILILIFFLSVLYADSSDSNTSNNNIWKSKNIWIKVYSNNRNYNITINNIVKIEEEIKQANKKGFSLVELRSKLDIQKSKLLLYERNKSFDSLLSSFKYEIPEVTIRDYLFNDSINILDKKIDMFIALKNKFYMASSIVKNLYENNEQSVSKLDIKYFNEYAENIEKIHLNLLDSRDELESRYLHYSQDKLQKHITTVIIIIVAYLIYKIFSFALLYIERKTYKDANQNNYKKILSIIFFILLSIFLVVRYMDDFMYIITFLSVIAAALTISLREVILNIVASVYIFFSNMIRVGDRVMIQFETKHTIGDIVDISLMKIKLNEIEDYTNVKEVKNVGRTTYIPNSYVFTKVFYNYSRKKDGLISDLIEFEFASDNDFENIKKVTDDILSNLKLKHTITFTLNNLKTGIIGLISYQTNYKIVSKVRGDVSIKLLQAYTSDDSIKLKSSKTPVKPTNDDGE